MERLKGILKKNKGVTLIEVLIVLAIIAIIGAIILPNFIGGTDRARLRSDLQSTQVIRNAVDLYRVENGAVPVGTDANAVLTRLREANYLTAQLADDAAQTEGLRWIWMGEAIYLYPRSAIDADILAGLSPQDLALIRE